MAETAEVGHEVEIDDEDFEDDGFIDKLGVDRSQTTSRESMHTYSLYTSRNTLSLAGIQSLRHQPA